MSRKQKASVFWTQFLKGRALKSAKNFIPFVYLPVVLLRVPFCAIITVSWSKGTIVFSQVDTELHVFRQENLV